MVKKKEEILVEEPVVILWDGVLMVPVVGILEASASAGKKVQWKAYCCTRTFF